LGGDDAGAGKPTVKASDLEREQVRDYFAAQMADDPAVHLEKVAVERVGSVLHDI
jgi:hypothetical protein